MDKNYEKKLEALKMNALGRSCRIYRVQHVANTTIGNNDESTRRFNKQDRAEMAGQINRNSRNQIAIQVLDEDLDDLEEKERQLKENMGTDC